MPMTKEVAGIDLKTFQEPIHDALKTFQEISDERVVFDLDEASKLGLTPEKPNSARSVTAVSHLGEAVGNLYVIAFGPHDGTGDESTHSLYGIGDIPKRLPREPKIVPRAKTGTHSEICLPLVSQMRGSRIFDPVMFAMNLDVIGFDDAYNLKQIGTLNDGYSAKFVDTLMFNWGVEPYARLTTGYDREAKRFGDPHAIYNGYGNVVQVAGFLAISDEIADNHASAAYDLKARRPIFL